MKLINLAQLIFVGTALASPLLHPGMARPGEPGLATHAGSPERHRPVHGVHLPPNGTHWPVEPDEPLYEPCEGEPDEPYDSPPFGWPPYEPEGGYGGYPEPYFGDGDDDDDDDDDDGPEWEPPFGSGPEWEPPFGSGPEWEPPFGSGPEWDPDNDSPSFDPWGSDDGDD